MIVVFGSINLDLTATVERLPSAGETRAGHSFSITPGGKGANQALAARRAGSSVAIYGAVGRDAFADPALALLRKDGVDVSNVRVVDLSTGVALIHVDAQGENAITVVAGANAQASADWVPDAALDTSTIVVMQFEVPLPEVEALARQAHAAGSRVILNAAPAQRFSAEILRQIDVLIVNEIEAEMLSDALEIAAPPEQFVSQYRTHFGRDAIVSLGPRGLVASSSAGVIAVAAPNVNIVDTVGAGDALVGALAAALDRKTPWMRTLKEAIAAGSLACTTAGAQPSLPQRDAIATLADTI
ncbi:MAG: ribokinase [Betaproteobacteria bacterium]|nr:MAG: ribokinase [Betaproteobacteria bacterium]